MRNADEHVLIPTLKRQLADRLIDRREFVRYAALLGMSATAAYAFVRKVTGEPFVAPAAGANLPKGGVLRIGMRCQDLKSPHTYSWVESSNSARQVLDYLTTTGVDNVTRPVARREVGGEPGLEDVDAAAAPQRQVAQRPAVHGRRRRLEPQAGARSQDRLLGARSHEGLPARGVRDRREGRQGQRQEVHASSGTPTPSRKSIRSR